MRKFTRSEMKTILFEADAYLRNSIGQPMVLEKVKPFNYDEETLAEGQEIYDEAERLYLETGPKRGKKINFSGKLKNRVDNIHKIYMLHVKKLRRELAKDPGLLKELGIYGRRDFTYKGKLKESKEFYKNCLDNANLGSIVSMYGLPGEKLDEYLKEISEIESDEAYKALCIKDSQKTTEDMYKAMLKLYNWCKSYKDVLVFVFSDDCQQLEAFKITAYSEGYDPHRKTISDEDDGGNELDENDGVSDGNQDDQPDEGSENKDLKVKEEEKKESFAIPLREQD